MSNKRIDSPAGVFLLIFSLILMGTTQWVQAQGDDWDEMGPESESSTPVGPFGSEAYTGDGEVMPDMEPRSETGGPAADVIDQGINAESRMQWVGGSGASPDPAGMSPTTSTGGLIRAGDVEAGLTDNSMRPQTETGGPLEIGPGHTSEYRCESGGALHLGTGADTPGSEVSATQRRRPESLSPGARDMTETELRLRREADMRYGTAPGMPGGPTEGQIEESKLLRQQEAREACEQISNPQEKTSDILESEGVQTY